MGLLPGGGVAGKLPSPVDSYWLHLLTSPIMSSHRGWAEDRPGFVGTLRFRPGLWAPPAEGRRMRNGGGGGRAIDSWDPEVPGAWLPPQAQPSHIPWGSWLGWSSRRS